MDIKLKIKRLVDGLDSYEAEFIMNSVVVHLDRADFFLHQAELLQDDQYYTDVVYRTNQAYEGILKYAYVHITGDYDDEGDCSLSTYQIESYFLKNQVFNKRVFIAFTLYRKVWRNPSVHDSALFFNRDEAFLAIVYVSAFIYILIKQVLEIRASIDIKKILADAFGDEYETIDFAYSKEVTEETILNQIQTFHKVPKENVITRNNISQIIGAIKGYLENKVKGLEVVTHYKGEDVIGYQPDIIIKFADSMLILEVKNEYAKEKLEFGYKQIKDYLFRSEVKQGILYFYTDNVDAEYEVNREWIRDREIITVKPKTEE